MRVALAAALAAVTALSRASPCAGVADDAPRLGSSRWFAPDDRSSFCEAFTGVGISSEGEVVAFDVFVGLPIVLFVVFLASQFRLSWRKLRCARDLVMPTYYALLWLVCLLNLLRVALQMWRADPGEDAPGDCLGGGRSGSSPAAWTALWLATRFGATFAEVTVLAFEPRASGVDPRAALRRALTVALGVALADAALESTLVFALGARLFAERPPVQTSVECPGTVANPPAKAVEAYKLAYWIARGVAFAVGYACVAAAPISGGSAFRRLYFRDWFHPSAAAGGGGVPNRGTFLRYAAAVGAAHLVSALAASLAASGARVGYCLAAVCDFAFDAGIGPAMYWAFLAEYFREDDFELESRYVSEMFEAGYWEGLPDEDADY